jgi:hypothetical protein
MENARSGRLGGCPQCAAAGAKGIPASEPDYLPLTEEVITAHLSGELELGLCPMLDCDQCCSLAADFDGPAAMLNALAHLRPLRPRRRGRLGDLPLRPRSSRVAVLQSPCSGGHRSAGRAALESTIDTLHKRIAAFETQIELAAPATSRPTSDDLTRQATVRLILREEASLRGITRRAARVCEDCATAASGAPTSAPT